MKVSSLFANRQRGHHYEALAESYLKRQGLFPVTRNFHARGGEIDLIMKDGDTWVFIEVKYRQSESFGSGFEAIDQAKLQRMRKTAFYWLQQQEINSEMAAIRFDAVYITPEQYQWAQNILVEG
uniref:YraN family protein n=1 Tax=Thaumasiovibrio occultus TaxID=1891184 RepID=UPI000B36182A|nr:YraN family protein [Thaumasiovibrio occultus]